MLREIYNWTRFWCPPTGKLIITDDGYLADPSFYNPEVVTFESLMEVPCLALLGEPGMGKSSAMRSERMRLDERIHGVGDQILWFDLRSYSSEDRLARNLFQHRQLLEWKQDSYHLHLFLDSLDEGLLRIETLAALLVEEFDKCDAKRLSVRIACRTVEWQGIQGILEDGLRRHWGKDSLKIYELTPLRRAEVAEAASVEGLEAEAFLREVSDREAGPLAAKPVTLRHLLRVYKDRGQLPRTQQELYFDGCRLLCEETNPSYTSTRLRDEFTAEQRMAVAGRIAVCSVFANRSAVWAENDTRDANPEDITFKELRGGYELIGSEQLAVTHVEVREALNTGLFSSRGSPRMGWAHQTYAEFLAAWYLTQHQVSTSQLMSLLTHPGNPEGKLVPQLHEVAAWVASMNTEVMRAIGSIEPDVLLRSDIAALDDASKESLVTDILRLYEEERSYDRDWSGYRRYRKLSHANLAAQLTYYIRDRGKNYLVRRIAVEIAEACGLTALQGELIDIVLDPSEDISLRSYAARAITTVADEATKLRLRPFIRDGAGGGNRDRLKGWALEAVWPQHITAAELFQVLTPPSISYAGSYTSFLSSDFLQHLQPSDLPIALEWVGRQSVHHLNYYLVRVVNNIMLCAWENLDIQGVAPAFARAALSRLRQHVPIVDERSTWRSRSQPPERRFQDLLGQDARKRRRIIEEMLQLIQQPSDVPLHLVHSGTLMVRSEDLPWMIERSQVEEAVEMRQRWASLISGTYNPSNPDEFNLVVGACAGNITLAREIIWDLRPIILDSDEARQMRLYYEPNQVRNEEDEEQPITSISVVERINAQLNLFEEGDLDAWWRLNHLMRLNDNGAIDVHDAESDLKAMPGWMTADLATRARLLEAARVYISERDAGTDEWLNVENIIYNPAYAGYRALRLLLEEEPEYVVALPAEVWRRWASIIVAFPTIESTDEESNQSHNRLVQLAYNHDPEEVIATLLVTIDKENARSRYLHLPQKVILCWDNRLGTALLDKARDPHLGPAVRGTLLRELLAHKVPNARTLAESIVALPLANEGDEREQAIYAAIALMKGTDDVGWPTIWPAIQSDPEFGREVIGRAATTYPEGNLTHWETKLTEEQLGNLYIWAAIQYPHSADHSPAGPHFVSPREHLGHWRDSLLQMIKERGTFAACASIERIMSALPELHWLKRVLLDAQDLALRNHWTPVEPELIFELVADQRNRLVRNAEQLLDVIKESLTRLQAKLHGETPAVRDLWNEPRYTDEQGKRYVIYTPKDEEAFSDIVKRHLDVDLRDRGVIVNREVVIRRGAGSSGERTDIHVDAITNGPEGAGYDLIKVIIESKGCWNRQLDSAMETQLFNRYLRDSDCRHGLYLIGWFMCDQWHNEDGRKGATPRESLAEARRRYDSQAEVLSTGGIKVEAIIIDAALR